MGSAALASRGLCGRLTSGAYESLYSDVKAAGVGDIVTVIILEKTLASNTSKISTGKATSFALSRGGRHGWAGLHTGFLGQCRYGPGARRHRQRPSAAAA